MKLMFNQRCQDSVYYGLVNGTLLAACDLLFSALRHYWSECGAHNKPSAQDRKATDYALHPKSVHLLRPLTQVLARFWRDLVSA
jgi:hypothetical protein